MSPLSSSSRRMCARAIESDPPDTAASTRAPCGIRSCCAMKRRTDLIMLVGRARWVRQAWWVGHKVGNRAATYLAYPPYPASPPDLVPEDGFEPSTPRL